MQRDRPELSDPEPRTNASSADSAERRESDLAMHIFSISAGMVGACLTGIGLVRVVVSRQGTASLGDEMLAADALLFLTCCGLSFWAFKTPHPTRRVRLRWIIDLIFLSALMVMVAVCAVMTYEIA